MSTVIVKNLNLCSKNINGQNDYRGHTLTILDKLLEVSDKLIVVGDLFYQEEQDISYIDTIREKLKKFKLIDLYTDKEKTLEKYFNTLKIINLYKTSYLEEEGINVDNLLSTTRYKYDDSKKDLGGNYILKETGEIKKLSLAPYSDTFNSASIFKMNKREKSYKVFTEAIVKLDSDNSKNTQVDIDDSNEYGRIKKALLLNNYKYVEEEAKCITQANKEI